MWFISYLSFHHFFRLNNFFQIFEFQVKDESEYEVEETLPWANKQTNKWKKIEK